MGPDRGFSYAQVRFGNGTRLEMVEPRDDGGNDFLFRFLDRHGPGPHHLSFRAPDVPAMLNVLEDAGYHPMRVTHGDPDGLEAFLHPKEATGVVIQIEQPREDTPITPVPAEITVPPARIEHAAHLDWIGHAVASLDEGLRLFGSILGGDETARGGRDDTAVGAEWVELEWPDEGRMRLFTSASETSPLSRWLGGRTGRIDHMALSLEDPAAVPDAVDHGDGTWEVAPERNFGVRLLLSRRQAMKQDAATEQTTTDQVMETPDAVLLPS